MTNPFDYVNEINFGKRDLIRDGENPDLAEKLYPPFMVNRALSYFADTIMFAELMNQHHELDHKMQNDFLLNTIKPSKRFSSWFKKHNDQDVVLVQQHYKVNRIVAQDYLKILSPQQLNEIRKIRNVE